MVSCLILYHATITSLTKCKLLRFIFHEADYEIEVIENNTVMIYLWNVKKMTVWQAAANFESTHIFVGFGFGERKELARKAADTILQKQINVRYLC